MRPGLVVGFGVFQPTRRWVVQNRPHMRHGRRPVDAGFARWSGITDTHRGDRAVIGVWWRVGNQVRAALWLFPVDDPDAGIVDMGVGP